MTWTFPAPENRVSSLHEILFISNLIWYWFWHLECESYSVWLSYHQPVIPSHQVQTGVGEAAGTRTTQTWTELKINILLVHLCWHVGEVECSIGKYWDSQNKSDGEKKCQNIVNKLPEIVFWWYLKIMDKQREETGSHSICRDEIFLGYHHFTLFYPLLSSLFSALHPWHYPGVDDDGFWLFSSQLMSPVSVSDLVVCHCKTPATLHYQMTSVEVTFSWLSGRTRNNSIWHGNRN